MDGVAYEGEMLDVGEGAAAVSDSASTNSLQRYPDGADTDDNSADSSLADPTPGVSNVVE